MDAAALRVLLNQAQQSLTAAISSVDTEPRAATDDMLAARLLIATALLDLRDDE